MKKMNKKRGFTILELTIVIAVIAILSAVLIPTFAGITKKAKQSADETAVRNMNIALSQTVGDEDIDIFDVSAALSENGFAAEEGLYPTLKDHAFYWHKPSNTIVYVNVKDGKFDLVYPEKVEGLSKATCQPLGTTIPTKVAAPAAPAATSATPVGAPAGVTTFDALVTYSNTATGKVECTLADGAKKTGVAFSGDVKLTADLVLGQKTNAGNVSMVYNIVADTTIDLNGFSIIQAKAGNYQSYAFFSVRKGATLNIIDSSVAQTGAIKVGNTAFQIDAGAVVNMYAGTITVAADRTAADIAYGASLVWTNGGVFNMFGGTLDVASTDYDLNWAVSNSGTANLFAGTIAGYIDESSNIYDIIVK